jgi:hypothetical protein
MTGLLTIGWRADAGARIGGRRLFDIVTSAAAALALCAATMASVLEQSRVDSEAGSTQQNTDGGRDTIAPGRESVIAAFTGAPYHYPTPARILDPGQTDFTMGPVNWYTKPFRNPIYYGARVAHWFNGKTGAGIDFIHSKAIAPLDEETNFSGTRNGQELPPRARIRDIINKLEFSHGHNMLLFNGMLRLPNLGPRVSPYVGAGAGILLPHTEVGFTDKAEPRTYEYNYAGPAAQALFGFEVRLAKVSFFIEYKFTYADYEAPLSEVDGSWLFLDLYRQVTRWFANEPPPGGHITTTIASHQVVGGLAVRIAPGR